MSKSNVFEILFADQKKPESRMGSWETPQVSTPTSLITTNDIFSESPQKRLP